jgi:hypothetical protein
MDPQVHWPEVAIKAVPFHPVKTVGGIHHQHTLKHIHKGHIPLWKFEICYKKRALTLRLSSSPAPLR